MKSKRLEKPRVLHEAKKELSKSLPHAPLITVPSRGDLHVVILSDRFLRYANHWVHSQSRVVWCPEDETCAECRQGWRNRIAFYAAVRVLDNQKLYTLALPESAWKWCPDLEPQQGLMRGKIAKVFRLRTGKQGPVRCQLLRDRRDPSTEPSAWNVVESVAKAFGMQSPQEEIN